MTTTRKIVLGILALVGLAIGYYGSMVYVGVTGSFASMTSACQMLRTAEKAGVLTPEQRGVIVDEMLAKTTKDKSGPGRAEGTKMIADGMKGDCKLLKLE